MELIEDPAVYRPLATKAIARYGHAPEHNVDCFECETHPEQKPVFVHFADGTALFIHRDKTDSVTGGKWNVFSEPVSPPERKAPILIELFKFAFSYPGVEKIVLELHQDTRGAVRAALLRDFRDLSLNYTLTWPIFDLINFDSNLPGKNFKELRKVRNNFYKTHKLTVAEAKGVPKEQLHAIVQRWRQKRLGGDRAYAVRYHNFIENNFSGTESARVILVDGEPVGINAGWRVPRSPDRYYGAIGLHDYSIKGLGEVCNLEDLTWTKAAGYQSADFGGGEKALTDFKRKFRPIEFYKTYIFSVVRRK